MKELMVPWLEKVQPLFWIYVLRKKEMLRYREEKPKFQTGIQILD